MAETPPTPPTAPTTEPAAPSRGADLRGATRLATDATAGLANLVEAMHERIARLPGSDAALDGRTGGISGLVYKTIRGVTRVAGGSIEALDHLVRKATDRTIVDTVRNRDPLVGAHTLDLALLSFHIRRIASIVDQLVQDVRRQRR